MSDETYWLWKAASPTPSFAGLPEGCFRGTQKQFESLSPGMRREILRDFRRREKERYDRLVLQTWDDVEHADKRQMLDRKADVQIKARERL